MAFKQKAPLFFKTSMKGYRKDSPDKNEPKLKIPGNNISMENVDHKVHGKDNFGNEKVMEPGKNYKFPGDYVIETPIKQGSEHQTADFFREEGGGGKDDKIPTQSELLLKRQRDKWKKKGDQVGTELVNTGSWSGAPTKHSLPGGEAHVHDYSFDKDTKEKDFTRRDKSIYVTNKKEKKKKKKKEESIPKKKKDTWYRDSDNDGSVISRAWKNRPKYKVIFNNSPMVPGFMKIVRKK